MSQINPELSTQAIYRRMDSKDLLLTNIAALEKRMEMQHERIAVMRAQKLDPAHAIAILDEMTKGWERLTARLEGQLVRKLSAAE
ncbi:MAG: hypothetical protein KF835_10695 [Xanthobacteraceae bacterium]|nr:hypothetical protein [Xanthobacteraceae bacterium]